MKTFIVLSSERYLTLSGEGEREGRGRGGEGRGRGGEGRGEGGEGRGGEREGRGEGGEGTGREGGGCQACITRFTAAILDL